MVATQLEVPLERLDRFLLILDFIGIQGSEREVHVHVAGIRLQRIAHRLFRLGILSSFLIDQTQRIVRIRILRRVLYRRLGGSAWQQARDGLPPSRGMLASTLATTDAEPGIFYAANNHGIYRSTDAGLTWEQLEIPWPSSFRLHRAESLLVQ